MGPATTVDFLLECIGFPPGYDLAGLATKVAADGEPTPWRGPDGLHLRLPLEGGLEVRLDQEEDEELPTLWPHFRVDSRLRVRVVEVARVPDSPFDALLHGTANPDVPVDPREVPTHYSLCTWITDRRRVPSDLRVGHVLAVSIAGFALDVSYLGDNALGPTPGLLERPHGALLEPLGDPESPGGCMLVSARIRRVRHVANPLTGIPVEIVEVDAPGRPLELFVSKWQLDQDGLETPRPGWRIEGVFLFTGRLAGGLPPSRPRTRKAFG